LSLSIRNDVPDVAMGLSPTLYSNNSIDDEQCQDKPNQKDWPTVWHQMIHGSPKETSQPSPHRYQTYVRIH